jgi:Multicopper oxidase
VIKNKRYRFRSINAASNVCPFTIQVENHDFEVIASDGSTFKPVKVDTLYLTAGERYDFVVNANQKESRDYWIRVKALTPCKLVEEFAILRYHEGKVPIDAKEFDYDDRIPPDLETLYPTESVFNCHQPAGGEIPISSAESYRNDQKVIHAKPDYSFKLFMGTPQLNNEELFTGDNTIKYMGE